MILGFGALMVCAVMFLCYTILDYYETKLLERSKQRWKDLEDFVSDPEQLNKFAFRRKASPPEQEDRTH